MTVPFQCLRLCLCLRLGIQKHSLMHKFSQSRDCVLGLLRFRVFITFEPATSPSKLCVPAAVADSVPAQIPTPDIVHSLESI